MAFKKVLIKEGIPRRILEKMRNLENYPTSERCAKELTDLLLIELEMEKISVLTPFKRVKIFYSWADERFVMQYARKITRQVFDAEYSSPLASLNVGITLGHVVGEPEREHFIERIPTYTRVNGKTHKLDYGASFF